MLNHRSFTVTLVLDDGCTKLGSVRAWYRKNGKLVLRPVPSTVRAAVARRLDATLLRRS